MTAADFRRLALSLPDTVESSHFNVPDFRVGGKIFATLGYEKHGQGVLRLTPEQQAGMIEDAPEIFSAVPGGYGLKGATLVRLSNVTEDMLAAVLRTAWSNRSSNRTTRVPRKRR